MPGPQAQYLNDEFMPVNTGGLSVFGGQETSSGRSIRTSVRHPISAVQHEPQTGKQGPRFVARLNITRGPLTSSGCSISHSLRHRATAGQTQPLMLIKKCLRWRLPCGTLVQTKMRDACWTLEVGHENECRSNPKSKTKKPQGTMNCTRATIQLVLCGTNSTLVAA